jgi:hypothetical protein
MSLRYKMAALFFFSSRAKLKVKKLKTTILTKSAENIEYQGAQRRPAAVGHWDCRFWESQAAPHCFFLRFQILHFFCKILKSYMPSGQCYEDNSFLIALPFSFIPCWSRFLEENNSYRHTSVVQIFTFKTNKLRHLYTRKAMKIWNGVKRCLILKRPLSCSFLSR